MSAGGWPKPPRSLFRGIRQKTRNRSNALCSSCRAPFFEAPVKKTIVKTIVA